MIYAWTVHQKYLIQRKTNMLGKTMEFNVKYVPKLLSWTKVAFMN